MRYIQKENDLRAWKYRKFHTLYLINIQNIPLWFHANLAVVILLLATPPERLFWNAIEIQLHFCYNFF